MSGILDDLPGVLCLTDDVIVFSSSVEVHDTRVRAVFRHLEDNSMTLNFDKCDFAKSSISYVGHIVSADGVMADPAEVRVITEM